MLAQRGDIPADAREGGGAGGAAEAPGDLLLHLQQAQVALGGCGEGAWLTLGQRSRVIRAAVDAARGRAPVLAGVVLPATGPAVEAARQAADAGADALVAGSPYYFAVDAGAQRRHLEALLAATHLPVLLHNIPPATHHVLQPDLVAALAADPRVVGIKDSARDLQAFVQMVAITRDRPAFKVLQGNEHVVAASLLRGGDGLVPGLANVVPSLFVDLVAASRRGDATALKGLQERIEDLGTLHAHGHWLPALGCAQ